MEVELMAVCKNLAELRATRGLSLRELGELTGYTSSYLSRIERGDSIPSLSGLATMATALGVELISLFEQAAGPRIHVSRASDPLLLNVPSDPDNGPSHRYTVLGAHGNEGAYTALFHDVPPGDGEITFRHFGERFCLMLAGSVEICLGGTPHKISENEWLHYASHEPHTMRTTGDEPARVLWIVSPAIF